MISTMKLCVGGQTFIIIWDFHLECHVKGENLLIYGFICAAAEFLQTLEWEDGSLGVFNLVQAVTIVVQLWRWPEICKFSLQSFLLGFAGTAETPDLGI